MNSSSNDLADEMVTLKTLGLSWLMSINPKILIINKINIANRALKIFIFGNFMGMFL
jgi:hypothetical protein